VFLGNRSGYNGGGISSHGGNLEIYCCTIAENRSSQGGGLYVNCSYAEVLNSIFWGNRASSPDYGNQMGARGNFDDKAIITLIYCNIEGLLDGVYLDWQGEVDVIIGNINKDPLFVQQGYWDDNGTPDWMYDDSFIGNGSDYHLRSQGWRCDTERKVWTWDDVTSRCIDAANPGSSLEDELLSIPYDPNNEWGINIRRNMGAYGGTKEASMAPYYWALLADLTNDGIVDYGDLGAQVQYWLITGNELPGDLNRDGIVNMPDLALLGGDYLKQTLC